MSDTDGHGGHQVHPPGSGDDNDHDHDTEGTDSDIGDADLGDDHLDDDDVDSDIEDVFAQFHHFIHHTGNAAGGGLDVFRYNGRYYISEHVGHGSYESLGMMVVYRVPTGRRYKQWLEGTRSKFAKLEKKLEEHVYTIRDNNVRTIPGMFADVNYLKGYTELPTELPYFDCLPEFQDDGNYQSIYPSNQSIYITDLDAQVLTIDFSVHYRLDNLPTKNLLWLRAIKPSVYGFIPTIDLSMCPEEHVASLAIELPEPDNTIGTPNVKYCDPHDDLWDNHTTLFALLASGMFGTYRDMIACHGRQWQPSSFPFREFAYSVVSCAAGLFSICPPAEVSKGHQKLHMQSSWSAQRNDKKEDAPIFQFGSMSHLAGMAPGAAPAETTYWLPDCFSDVLVSLVLVVDGKATTEAMNWGIASKRKQREEGGNFFMVIMSLFDVILAEVKWSGNKKEQPHLRLSDPRQLSPIRPEECLSTHPRERPVFDTEASHEEQDESIILYMDWSRYAGDAESIQFEFPGIASMALFFDSAKRRHDANEILSSRSTGADKGSPRGRLPYELYPLILDHLDHTTWKACLTVSHDLHAICMKKYHLDDHTLILNTDGYCEGYGIGDHEKDGYGLMYCFVHRIDTGDLNELRQSRGGVICNEVPIHEWITVIGEGQRKVALLAMPQKDGRMRKSDLMGDNGSAHALVWPMLAM